MIKHVKQEYQFTNYKGYELRQITIDTWSIWLGNNHIGNARSKVKCKQIVDLLLEWGDLSNQV